MKWPRGGGITGVKWHFMKVERTPTESFVFARGDAAGPRKGCLLQRSTLCCRPLWVKARFLHNIISTFPCRGGFLGGSDCKESACDAGDTR